jgi:hypothetical protein
VSAELTILNYTLVLQLHATIFSVKRSVAVTNLDSFPSLEEYFSQFH